MRLRLSLTRFLLLAFVLLVSASPSGCVGCGGEPEPHERSALRVAFPEHAVRVLDGAHALTRSTDGFELAQPDEERPRALRGVHLRLPRVASDGVRFELSGGFVVKVRENGASDEEGALAGNAVAYPREGGTSYWMVAANGYEEWLHLDPGATTGGRPAASWEIEGATLREAASGIAIADETGATRLVVSAPAAYGASGKSVDARLSVRGQTLELWVDAGGEAVLVDPMWSPAASMATDREAHAGALLGNGKVLVAGGYDIRSGVTSMTSAELYDPATDAWSAAAPMSTPRQYFTATLLGNGKVLVAGGIDTTFGPAKTAELYDPVANTWSPAGAMSIARAFHTATRLGNGKVLVAGGSGSASAELYDPATNTWSPAGAMSTVREQHTATLLGNGQVLVAGGHDNSVLITMTSAELYDPVANTWSPAGVMSARRYGHTATLLGNGQVLVAGGEYYDPAATPSPNVRQASAELYDPVANTWSPAGTMTSVRSEHTATVLGNGKVLIAGGRDATTAPTTSAERYDPVTGTWKATGAMSSSHARYIAVLLGNGKVLAAGGTFFAAINAELYTPVGDPCSQPSDCPSGFCVDGVCCDEACSAGPCDACSIAAGAATDGICALLTGPVCNDGNACTQTDTCQSGVCAGSNPVTCTTPPDACHTATGATCDSATGACSYPAKPNGTACNDGNACTQTDTCQSGVCTGSNPVTCTTPPDACHTATGATCNGATGVCTYPAKPNGTACNDGNACTQTDTCQSGVCTGSNPVTCAASDQCHAAGTCNAATGQCSNPPAPDGTACNDGNACSKSDVCTAGACGGAAYTCTPTSCQASSTCDGNGGCTVVNKGAGVACPDDGNACTSDACDGAGACQHASKADGASCGAGQVCASGTCASECFIGGVLYAAGAVNPANACLACAPATSTTAWSNRADGAACDDGNACTKNDVCAAGTCGGTAYTCTPTSCQASSTCDGNGGCTVVNEPSGAACPDDGNACSSDTCNGAGACTYPLLADGTACGAGQLCEAGSCGPKCQIGGQLYAAGALNPANACEQCSPATSTTAWSHRANGTSCDDGNACTKNDVCSAGVCGGTAYACTPGSCEASSTCDGDGGCTVTPKGAGVACADDGNPCTADACDGAGTCAHPTLADGASCGAGQVCQGGGCAAACFIDGVLVAAGAANPANACEVCAPAASTTSWSSKADGAACDDGDACTQTDTCQAGTCTGADPVVCAASDPCHAAGTCDPATGACSNPSKADGTPCDDGDACTQTDTCQAGACTGGNPVVCAASDQCHDVGTCDSATGQCGEPAKADGAACDDGNACSQTDTCVSGVCVGGNAKSCAAIDECHVDGTCDTATGDCSAPAKTDGEACSIGTCQGGVCTASPDGGMGGSGGSGGAASTSGSGGAASTGGSGGTASTSGSGGTASTGGSGGTSGSTSSGSSGAASTGGSGGESTSSSGNGPDESGGCGCRVAGLDEGAERGPIGMLVGLMLVAGVSRRRGRGVRRAA